MWSWLPTISLTALLRVQVPVQQSWQLNLAPTSGLPNIAVRRDLVPNEFRNDASSETPANVGASVTLVPPPPGSGIWHAQQQLFRDDLRPRIWAV